MICIVNFVERNKKKHEVIENFLVHFIVVYENMKQENFMVIRMVEID